MTRTMCYFKEPPTRTANRYRKSMMHKRQDYLERPRKKGTKYANNDIAPDQVIQHIEAGYDMKCGRWNGYDPAEHKKLHKEYEAVAAERQRLREEIDKSIACEAPLCE